ncbi:hypothetical protein LJC56_03540 [Christensenellaceae bacterium OttesenSCG-928-K19]|nr:hypothetical protein [Christensenellaceae bacterium OttesenSCG-928-K19]
MKERILILLFCIMIILPSILYIVMPPDKTAAEMENRQMASGVLDTGETERGIVAKALDLLTAGGDLSAAVEDVFNDNIPFRGSLIKTNTNLNLSLFHTLGSNQVVLGKDGWYFYNNETDNSPLKQFALGSSLSEDQLQTVTEQLTKMKDLAKENGAEFIFLIAPNKPEVYPEYVPDAYRKTSTERIYYQLGAYLSENTEITVLLMQDELDKLSPKYTSYFKTDTHWNNLAAFIATQNLATATGLQENHIELDELEITLTHDSGKDLLNLAGIGDANIDDNQYTIEGFMDEVTTEEWLVNEIGTRQKVKTNSPNDKKLLMYRDSFAEAMIPYTSKYFSESYYISGYPRDRDDKSMSQWLAEENPDIVVFEIVERSLADLPEFLEVD